MRLWRAHMWYVMCAYVVCDVRVMNKWPRRLNLLHNLIHRPMWCVCDVCICDMWCARNEQGPRRLHIMHNLTHYRMWCVCDVRICDVWCVRMWRMCMCDMYVWYVMCAYVTFDMCVVSKCFRDYAFCTAVCIALCDVLCDVCICEMSCVHMWYLTCA